MILVIVGESASGKSTVEKMIADRNPLYHRVISYTTRPMREGEVDGVNYHFITKEKYDEMVENGDFIEHAVYRDWFYGSAKSDYNDGENHVAVLTPHGCRSLKRWAKENDVEVYSIYIKVDRRSRLMKLLERGDDIEEAYRRTLSDLGQFDGFEDEADYVIENDGFIKNQEQIFREVVDDMVSLFEAKCK